LKRNAGLAGTALAGQDEIADDRDIVVPWDPVITVRAMGRGEDNRLVFRQATDAYIQKRADHGAKDENENVKGNREYQLCSRGINSNPFKSSNLLE
jgi:hypothetical protein